MKHFLATSNHGNHTGFNRKWTVEEVNIDRENPLINIALNASDNHVYLDDASEEAITKIEYVGPGVYDNSNMILEVTNDSSSYEHDLVYYLLIAENEIDAYIEDNNHYAGLYAKLCHAAGIDE